MELLRDKKFAKETDLFNMIHLKDNPVIEKTMNTEEDKNEEQAEVPLKIAPKEKFLLLFRIKDILVKCYPDLAYSIKKGLSLKKVMKKYSWKEFPKLEERTSSLAIESKDLIREELSNASIRARGTLNKRRGSKIEKKELADMSESIKKNLMPSATKKPDYFQALEDKSFFVEEKKSSTQQKDVNDNSFQSFKSR